MSMCYIRYGTFLNCLFTSKETLGVWKRTRNCKFTASSVLASQWSRVMCGDRTWGLIHKQSGTVDNVPWFQARLKEARKRATADTPSEGQRTQGEVASFFGYQVKLILSFLRRSLRTMEITYLSKIKTIKESDTFPLLQSSEDQIMSLAKKSTRLIGNVMWFAWVRKRRSCCTTAWISISVWTENTGHYNEWYREETHFYSWSYPKGQEIIIITCSSCVRTPMSQGKQRMLAIQCFSHLKATRLPWKRSCGREPWRLTWEQALSQGDMGWNPGSTNCLPRALERSTSTSPRLHVCICQSGRRPPLTHSRATGLPKTGHGNSGRSALAHGTAPDMAKSKYNTAKQMYKNQMWETR